MYKGVGDFENFLITCNLWPNCFLFGSIYNKRNVAVIRENIYRILLFMRLVYEQVYMHSYFSISGFLQRPPIRSRPSFMKSNIPSIN